MDALDLSLPCCDLQLEELLAFHPRRRETEDGSWESSSQSTPPNAGASSAPAFGSMDITDFKLIKPISRGSFGRVYLCEKKTTKDFYAIKARLQTLFDSTLPSFKSFKRSRLYLL